MSRLFWRPHVTAILKNDNAISSRMSADFVTESRYFEQIRKGPPYDFWQFLPTPILIIFEATCGWEVSFGGSLRGPKVDFRGSLFFSELSKESLF